MKDKKITIIMLLLCISNVVICLIFLNYVNYISNYMDDTKKIINDNKQELQDEINILKIIDEQNKRSIKELLEENDYLQHQLKNFNSLKDIMLDLK